MTNTTYNRVLLGIAFLLLSSLVPTLAHAQTTPSTDAEQTYFDFQVEQPVRVKSGRPPLYPERLRATNTEGQVLVQFVVDEKGIAQMNTFKVIKSTDNELTESVRRAISTSTYFPAEVQGRKVKQLVQQPYKFTPKQ